MIQKLQAILYLVRRVAGEKSVSIRKVLRPPTAHLKIGYLVFLCLQTKVETVPKMSSCYCTLLMQPSRFKFTKINPLALK